MIFFNSSMPRSGSTLMQNILGNNPDIYATPTSSLVDLLLNSKKIYTTAPAFKAQDEMQMKTAFLTYCRFGLEGYFSGLTNKPYKIDKSRAWAINMAFLDKFYPNPKIICMVRDLRDIVASMEKNYRKNPHKWQGNPKAEPTGVTIGERVGIWLEKNPVGTTLKNLKEVIHQGFDKKILFVKFEDLCVNPKKEMKRVYDFFEIPYYDLDYSNIQQVTFEDDKFHGIYGDHKIKNNVTSVPSVAKEVLGLNIYNQIYNKNKWYFDYFDYKQ